MLRVPDEKGDTPPIQEGATTIMNVNPLSILLVDDDPDTQQIVRLIMDHHKYPLTIAPNAQTALKLLSNANDTPDVVMLDIYLPDGNGYDTLKAIRKSIREHPPLVVAITAYYNFEIEAEMVARGFDGYLRKPFSAVQLVPYLQTLVSARQQLGGYQHVSN
jgi:CheY-like chemotaxis protein